MNPNQSNLKRMDNVGIVYENMYRLCYIRGPEQILIGLAEELNQD